MDFQPDVVILDIMLPDIDGLEVCKKNKGFFLLLYTVLILQKMMISIRFWDSPAAVMTTLQNPSAP